MREAAMSKDRRVQRVKNWPPKARAETHAAAEWSGARVCGRMMNRILRVRRHGREQSTAREQQRDQRISMRISHDGLPRVSWHD
jgi:hypothetical protein